MMEGLTIQLWVLVLLVAITPAFDFMNSFHDGAYSLAHSGNDAQKTIGIIWPLLISAVVATTDVATLPN
jgi:phosphate/sulfate permease